MECLFDLFFYLPDSFQDPFGRNDLTMTALGDFEVLNFFQLNPATREVSVIRSLQTRDQDVYYVSL